VSVRTLETLLAPRSVAVIGASTRAGALGQRVLENIIDSGFEGPIFAVNPKRVELDDQWWVSSVADLPTAPDLAIVVTPAETVPQILSELGALGTRLAVVLSAGFHDGPLRQRMLDAARPHLLRVVGPNCLGVVLPHARLNATFAHRNAAPGGLALLSQSGALVTAMIEWAQDRRVGFSGIVSVGDMADVDLGDLIDLFAADPRTNAIALYVEGIAHAAKFMAAARAAARTKPVIILKAGRSSTAVAAAMSHTAALAGAYDVHQAAFRRAGMVAVDSLTDLFDAAQILASPSPRRGGRLAIVSNGGGPAILAVDRLETTGGRLAQLSADTLTLLDAALPAGWSRANPIDLVGDAGAERFGAAVRAASHDPGVDAILVIHCPTALASGAEVARAVVEQQRTSCILRSKPLLACWLGADNAAGARSVFAQNGTPVFDNLDDAVRGFGYLLAADQARTELLRTPAQPKIQTLDIAEARRVIDTARRQGRTLLTSLEAKAVLAAFGVPLTPSRFAADAAQVADACASLTPPFAIKIVSRDIPHKSDTGGVILGLRDADAAREAALAMLDRIRTALPNADITGFEVEELADTAQCHELLVGVADDPQFGPVIAVGAGGVDVELIGDRVLGLPPLDDVLARDMLARTRVAKLLAAHRGQPAADAGAVTAVMEAISALCVELPDVVELDINPLLVGPRGAIALDARIRITAHPAPSRMALRVVPTQWTADLSTRSGVKLHVRPVLPSDEWALAAFFHHVSGDDRRFRFLSAVQELGHDRLAAMTEVDYRRTINFLAFAEDETLVATAMLSSSEDKSRAEFAISVHQAWKGKGISWTMTDLLLRYAKAEGIKALESLESRENHAAISLEREFGFHTLQCKDSPSEVVARKIVA
jgi:acetyltransferase